MPTYLHLGRHHCKLPRCISQKRLRIHDMKLVQKPRPPPQSPLLFSTHRLSACADLGRNITHADMTFWPSATLSTTNSWKPPSLQYNTDPAAGTSSPLCLTNPLFDGKAATGLDAPSGTVSGSMGSPGTLLQVPSRNAPCSGVTPNNRWPDANERAGRRGPKSTVSARLRGHAGKLRATSLREEARHRACRNVEFYGQREVHLHGDSKEVQCVIVALSSPNEGSKRVWFRPHDLGRWK